MNLAEQVKGNLDRLRKSMDVTRLDDRSLVQAIEEQLRLDTDWQKRSLNERSSILNGVYSAIRGYDILDVYFSDPEIMVNRFDEVYVEKTGVVQRVKNGFATEEKYHDIIQKIVNDAGKEVHQRTPIVDCRMKDGSRVNVVLQPISGGDAALTIRRFRKHIFSLADLVENGTLSASAAAFLRKSVRAKINIFISGGTGSGKTTLLNALANEIDRHERLITIEDARELNFENIENWVALEARRPNAAGDGEITIRDLIRASLRMRPDRIIVGEVRGPEALDAIQAMNTGHDGSFSTGHANSVSDMQLRLETMILSGHDGLPLPAIRQQIASAIDLFVHVSRLRDHRRYVVRIEEPYWENDSLHYHPLFSRSIDEHTIGALEPTGEEMRRKDKFYRAGEEV